MIDEFGRIAATILPRIDIEEAWGQLANFPMPPDDEELLPDGDAESTDDAAQQGSGASSTASYPVRQMMQLIENIAAKQTSVSKADWVTWCTRLEQCLIQAAGSKVLEEFVKLNLNPLSPLWHPPFRPAFASNTRNSGRASLRERAQTGGNCLECGRSQQNWRPGMNQMFQGWEAVAEHLRQQADVQDQLAREKGEDATRLNPGQRASLRAIASRIVKNGVVIADEVGMGKTRIAVEVARCVIKSGGRVAILVPPGLGYQWQAELRDGEVNDVPPILRSLYAYLAAWADNQQPWFEKQAVMVSHAFTNWRLGENAAVWRWALVPELYARWREMTDQRLPRGYHDNRHLAKGWVCSTAAKSIAAALPKNRKHPIRRLLDQFVDVQWPRPLDAAEYSKYGALRHWLERSVGIGLGVFDLVIIDEAHKSRGTESGLSRLLENVIVSSDTARRLALTATPVELDVSQWHSTLSRLGLERLTQLGPGSH